MRKRAVLTHRTVNSLSGRGARLTCFQTDRTRSTCAQDSGEGGKNFFPADVDHRTGGCRDLYCDEDSSRLGKRTRLRLNMPPSKVGAKRGGRILPFHRRLFRRQHRSRPQTARRFLSAIRTKPTTTA